MIVKPGHIFHQYRSHNTQTPFAQFDDRYVLVVVNYESCDIRGEWRVSRYHIMPDSTIKSDRMRYTTDEIHASMRHVGNISEVAAIFGN